LPHLAGVVIERVARVAGIVEIKARAGGDTADCPGCGARSGHVHSRYERSLADAAIGGQQVRIRLRVRRFRCATAECARRTFVEQIDDLTVRYGRRSRLLHRTLEAIAVALAGRAGARLAKRISAPVSRATLLRIVRALPEHSPTDVTAVGVDDFALRRGHVYGTVIIDINSHRPLEVLPDRTADTLENWLKQYPGVRIVCRDRAGAYAEGARAGAPVAVQVADRWHLWHNLAQAVEKTVIAHRSDLVELADGNGEDVPASGESPKPLVDTTPVENRLAVRTRERYAAINELRERGMSISAICRQLNLDRKTVRRFTQATGVELLLVRAHSRASLLDAFKPYLHERFNAGHIDAAALTAEIKAMGYRGSDKTVRRYLHPFRAALVAPPPVLTPPSVRQVTGWLTRRPQRLSEDERMELKKILDRSDVLAITQQQVRDFAEMLTARHGERLAEWMCDVDSHGPPPLRSFVAGLRTDLDAVTAGLTLDYSSGPVEGTVNRIKMIKRQMFGRAKFDLLRKRVLNPA
jgi:transposase